MVDIGQGAGAQLHVDGEDARAVLAGFDTGAPGLAHGIAQQAEQGLGMDGGHDGVGTEATAVGAGDGPVFHAGDLLAQADILSEGERIGQRFSTAAQTPDTELVRLEYVASFVFRAGRQAQESIVAANQFIRFHRKPGQIHQTERPEDLFQRFARAKPADGVEARVKADPFADEGLECAAGLCALFQDGHSKAPLGQDLAAEQAAESGPDDQDAFFHDASKVPDDERGVCAAKTEGVGQERIEMDVESLGGDQQPG